LSQEEAFGRGRIRLVKGDITDLPIEAFVYYARPDLVLGAGFGTAISVRGGPSIQEQLRKLAPVATGDAVVTGGGNMKAKYIIHAVGPRFQEKNTEEKLRATTLSVLKRADEHGIKRLAFPAMGAGFYGVPLEVGAEVVLSTVDAYLRGQTGIEEVVFCLIDTREFVPYQVQLAALGGSPGVGPNAGGGRKT